jgi:hypothetical protein
MDTSRHDRVEESRCFIQEKSVHQWLHRRAERADDLRGLDQSEAMARPSAPPSQAAEPRQSVAHRGSGGYAVSIRVERQRRGTSIKHIFRIVGDAMFFQQRNEFVFE